MRRVRDFCLIAAALLAIARLLLPALGPAQGQTTVAGPVTFGTGLSVSGSGTVSIAANVVTGPGSSTDGWVPGWSGTSGAILTTGYQPANSGADILLQTDGSGHINTNTLNIAASGSGGKIVCDNGGSLYLGSATSC
jgi:hypothetical protein